MKPFFERYTEVHFVLRALTIWRYIYAGICAIGILAAWLGFAQISWQPILISLALLVAGGFSLASARQIPSRRHGGRTISLFLDYLTMVAGIIIFLNVGNAFVGIDELAAQFTKSIPAIGVILLGYLIGLSGEFFHQQGLAFTSQENLQRAGNWVMLAGAIYFLLAVNAFPGLLVFAGEVAQPAGIFSLIAALLCGLGLWAMWRQSSAHEMGARAHHDQMLNGWLFLSPNLLGFMIFFAGPLLLSFYFSFTDSDAFNTPHFIGLANYARLLNITFRPLTSATQLAKELVDVKIYDEVGRLFLGNTGILFAAEDKFFWLALKNTLTFALFAVPLSVIPALFLANILNGKLPGMKFFRAIYFLPSIAAIVGISLVWQWLYNAAIGYINYFITSGITLWNTLFNAGVADPRIQWVSDEKTALLAIILIAAWQTMGFNTVLFLAGLQNIPRELYEAATVDGAGAWNKFWDITIPLLAPSTFYVLTTTTIQAMQVFEQVFILMNPPEGPNNSTITLVLYLYRSGFQNFKQGYASAIAWVLFIVIFGITMLQFQRQRKSSIYEN